jgi:hypothetical protein
MEFMNEIGQLNQSLQAFLIEKGSALPEFCRTKIVEAVGSPSPVERIVKSCEALYAVKDVLDADGQMICAQLAQFAALNGWHGMDQDNRGGRIAQAMQRDLGEKAPTGDWPERETDPEASADYQAENVADDKALTAAEALQMPDYVP